jgi:leader peptidase (prepilin peptidase)/N-methyltransferase
MILTGCSYAVYLLFSFIVGACLGSFFNVCIYRIPLDRSIVSPGSHCAACGSPIPALYNIPIISWLYLRGKAACCGTKIDVRYMLVELLTGALFLALAIRYPRIELAAVYAIFTSGLIISSFIDIDHYIIPDRFTLGGCVVGFVCSALVPEIHGESTAWDGFRDSLWGAFVSGMVLLVVAFVGTRIFKKEAMGFGDVKFLAAIGSFLGSVSITFILPVSAFLGSVFGLLMLLRGSGTWGSRMPYGPFLALAALIWIFGGSQWTTDYWRHVYNVLTAGGTIR